MGRSIIFTGYSIQRAPRKPGSSYPAGPWKTMRGLTHLSEQEAGEKLAKLQAARTTFLYRAYITGGR